MGSSLFNLESVWAAPFTRRNLGGMAASDPILGLSICLAAHAASAISSERQ
jgi:hypothetical protein